MLFKVIYNNEVLIFILQDEINEEQKLYGPEKISEESTI